MRTLTILIVALALPLKALAGDLSVELKNPSGQPVGDAVVSFRPASGAVGPLKTGGVYEVSQKDVHFDPFILVVPVGAEVAFPNKDKVRHHVYSFSAAKRFEIRLYGRDEAHKITFDKPGIVALGCNIHDQMIGFIDVVDTPYAVRVGANGAATLTNIPAGGGTLTVWQPFLRAPGNQMVQTVTIPAQGAAHAALTLNVRAAPTDKTPLL